MVVVMMMMMKHVNINVFKCYFERLELSNEVHHIIAITYDLYNEVTSNIEPIIQLSK